MIISAGLNKLIHLNAGDIVVFPQNSFSIKFTGTGTVTMDNDDVISDASFELTISDKTHILILECINGKSSVAEKDGYRITLDFADGYSQTCGITISLIN